MRRRTPLLAICTLALGLLGAWAGTGAGALPPPPTLTVPTVTVTVPPTPPAPLPPAPLPPPPPTPTVTVAVPPAPPPPPLPQVPQVPTPPVSTPVPVPPVDVPPLPGDSGGTPPPPIRRGSTRSRASAFGAGAASSRMFTLRRRDPGRYGLGATTSRPRAAGEKGVLAAAATASAPARRPIAEPAPSADVLGTLASVARAVPAALFAMAALAVLLLAAAAIPQPVGASRTGAMLVHRRGSIAVAGLAALAAAVVTYLLL
jgi:hypothetical protein